MDQNSNSNYFSFNLTLPEIMARFPDEKSAVEYLESLRWPDGVICPHCGNADKSKIGTVAANKGKKIRVGLRQCGECRKQFRVTVGTIFEDSHLPLNLWIIAWYLICGAKKGMSALQLQRHLGIGSYKSAWFMCHRIRYAMSDSIYTDKLKGVVEVDETYIGGKTKGLGRAYKGNKTPVVTLVERGGRKRSIVMEHITAKNLRAAVEEHVAGGSTVHTDELAGYLNLKTGFNHDSVNHSKGEYVRKGNGSDPMVMTNTVESSFSLLKRGVVGSFHHISKKHLGKYIAEFDFRWDHRKTNDSERTVKGLEKTFKKNLTYRELTRGREKCKGRI